jgi:hypothetical protein
VETACLGTEDMSTVYAGELEESRWLSRRQLGGAERTVRPPSVQCDHPRSHP